MVEVTITAVPVEQVDATQIQINGVTCTSDRGSPPFSFTFPIRHVYYGTEAFAICRLHTSSVCKTTHDWAEALGLVLMGWVQHEVRERLQLAGLPIHEPHPGGPAVEQQLVQQLVELLVRLNLLDGVLL